MKIFCVVVVLSAVVFAFHGVEARLQPPWTLCLEHAISEKLGGGEIASYSFDVLKEAADASVERLVIRQCGLLLPRVSIGSPSLLFIQQGSGVVELIDDNGQKPATESVVNVKSGDAVVIPKGWTYSIGNYLNESPELIITAVRFSHHKQKSYLAGSKPHSVLSGFGLHILETAFNQPHDVVRALLQQATEGGIIVSHCVPPSPPELSEEEKTAGSLEDMVAGRGAAGVRKMASVEDELEVNMESKKKEKKEKKGKKEKKKKTVSLVYHVDSMSPAISTEGGSMIRVSYKDFKALRLAGIEGEIVLLSLYPYAVVAPHIHGNAAVVFTVLQGSAHFESVLPNGTLAASDIVETGHVGVVPTGYTHALQAGEQGVKILGIRIGSYHPAIKFLAGSTSVYKAMRPALGAEAFNITEEDYSNFFGAQDSPGIVPWRGPTPGKVAA